MERVYPSTNEVVGAELGIFEVCMVVREVQRDCRGGHLLQCDAKSKPCVVSLVFRRILIPVRQRLMHLHTINSTPPMEAVSRRERSGLGIPGAQHGIDCGYVLWRYLEYGCVAFVPRDHEFKLRLASDQV